jgi:thiol-disulfide isomerase/thioredoxin
MKQKIKMIIGLAGLALLIVIAVIAYNTLRRYTVPDTVLAAQGNGESGEVKAPDFGLIDIHGNEVRLSDLIANGKPIVLNFWASWCPPCKIEMPDFNRVYLELGDEVQFMMVDLVDGQRETVQSGTKYITDNNYSFPIYFDVRQEAAYTYGIRSIPTTLFINKDGYIVTGVQGMIDEGTLRRGIGLIQ